MKKNISILVLFGLLLAFGVLVASCDNGVLPEHTTDPLHIEGELDGVYNPLNPPGATVAIDFYDNSTGALGYDGTADGPTMSASAAASLTAGYIIDPADGQVYSATFAVNGDLIQATKDTLSLGANVTVGPNGKL